MTKEEKKAYQAAYYLANKERLRAKDAVWHKANSKKVRARNAAWQKANPERVRANYSAWRKANPEKASAAIAAWHKANPEKSRAIVTNRRARVKGAEGQHTAKEIKQLLARQKCRCVVCKKSIEDGYHEDHIVPLSRGGSNCIRNIQLLCPTCNCRKGSKPPVKFMQEMGFLL